MQLTLVVAGDVYPVPWFRRGPLWVKGWPPGASAPRPGAWLLVLALASTILLGIASHELFP